MAPTPRRFTIKFVSNHGRLTMQMESMSGHGDTNDDEAGRHSGRWVVIAMFAFAALVVGSMWVYIDRHTAPFRPLRQALAREFENSAPNVEGGQTKMHK